jgi:hypothetical protein
MTPTVKLILILFGLAYLISPVDIIPDLLLPVVGWIDDSLVIWCIYYLIRYGELPWFFFNRSNRSGRPAGPGKTAFGKNFSGKRSNPRAAAGNGTVPPKTKRPNPNASKDKQQAKQSAGRRYAGKQARQNSCYQILGVDPSASWQEIQTAYKEKRKQYHPDKLSHLGEEFSSLANEKFLEIQEAYAHLKDIHNQS